MKKRGGAALLLALFVMTLTSALVVGTLDAQRMRYMALRNTWDWDRARYLAEAGLHEALSHLESDFGWRAGITTTEYPAGSGSTYSATVSEGDDGAVTVVATGQVGDFSRHITATVKHGG
ncbi:MAG: hypothetical protein KDB00_06160 [Planctomycetales bacterium]|nr:hypothetical protein [Planctomycetales bacterium]